MTKQFKPHIWQKWLQVLALPLFHDSSHKQMIYWLFVANILLAEIIHYYIDHLIVTNILKHIILQINDTFTFKVIFHKTCLHSPWITQPYIS